MHSPEFNGEAIAAIEAKLHPHASRETGLILECKEGAIALHYRQRPELEAACIAAMEDAAAAAPGVILRRRKMVVEAVGDPSDKGTASAAFLTERPFLGRVPVFAGDELTDEDGFALFFDFDGTLAEIVQRPEDVEVTQATREALEALWGAFGGAVAIITGRDIPSIDLFLAPVRLPIAGVHGLSRRDAEGQMHSPKFNGEAIAAIEAKLQPLASRETGLILECKEGAIALHYRQRPELEAACIAAMEDAAAAAPGVILRRGKMVVEAVGYPSDKGTAIAAFLTERPFLGRVPVFAGDDLTDEDGFALVNAREGIAI
jgi:trehalose 6-phosphate phosphatase